MFDLFQGDIVEMVPYNCENKGYKYIMTVINLFSKLGFAVPLKSKLGEEVAQALEPILKQHHTKHFQTDQEKEFFNFILKKLLVFKNNINHYYTFSDLKASIVKRFNQTIIEKMWRAISMQGNYKWVDLLPIILKNYSKTIHRTIGIKPIFNVTKNMRRL